MAILQKDIKLLWGRAASRCAICKQELTQDKKGSSDSYPIGEQAHIVAENSDGPRGKSILTPEQRNSYHNLILLCPNHHSIIDKGVEDYPIEKLHLIKSEHELWVQQKLSEPTDSPKTVANTVYGHVIDKAVELCGLEYWESWTSLALGVTASWDEELTDNIFKFSRIILATVWPETLPELERSLQTLSIVLNEASNVFLGHAEYNGGRFTTRFFYKERTFPEEVYQQKLKEFKKWKEDSNSLIYEATKAANWFADIVRRDINPMFFATEGKFLVTRRDIVSGFESFLIEYFEDEKKLLPKSFMQRRQVTQS